MTISNGPWKAVKFQHTDFVHWDVDYPRFSDERFSVLEDLTEEDAYLIAAAPDLLEALQACIETNYLDPSEPAYKKAKAALKKAKSKR